MRGWVACVGGVVLASSSTVLARDSRGRAVYCTLGEDGAWSLGRFKPLINAQTGTVFAELTFAGAVLDEVRLRRFYPDSELAFEYRFDAAGRLTGLRGKVTVRSVPPPGEDSRQPLELADWLGEADLLPGGDGKIPPHHVFYSRERDRIDRPENAGPYVARFNQAPVYSTTRSVPCAASLREAEKMNATQE